MTLVHPGLTAALTTSGHFGATGTVQFKTVTNTRGNPSESWANVAGLVDIPCAIAAATADEQRAMPAYATRTHKALLDGDYTAIDPTVHRFVSGGVNYDILGAEHDSQSATTRLHLREVLH
jgi:hypothetical protein